MNVRLLYFDGCPNWQEADRLLDEAVARTGRRDVTVEHVLVTSPEDAERWRFRGSPTVLIDGHDPLAHADAPIGFSCRVYPSPTGPTGTPSLQQLLDVLTDR